MATGLPARWVLVCAVLLTAPIAHVRAQGAGGAGGADDAPPAGPGRRTVAVIALSPDPAAEALANELYGILTNHPDLQPVSYTFIGSLKGRFADEERPALEAARRAKVEADELLAQLDYRNAEAAADRGTESLQNVRPSPEVLGLYAELSFLGGQAALRQRKPNDAAMAFHLSYRLDPAKRPDPIRFEPDVVEAYQLASQRAAVPAKLQVVGTGTVWIDGIDRGLAPGTFDVTEGAHLVQLSGPGRETRGRQVRVPQSTAVEIDDAPASEERKVERARIELAGARDATARAGAMKKLSGLLGVGDVVLIDTGADGTLVVGTWRDRAPGFSAMTPHDTRKPAEVLAPLAPPPRKPGPPIKNEVIPQPPPMVETPLVRRRWFQGAVAAGLLGIAATVIVFATQDRVMPNPNPDTQWAD